MSTLAAYFDTSNASFLFIKDKKHINIFPFPYVYSKSMFGNQCSEKEFCQGILDTALANNQAKASTCDLVVSSFRNPPEFSVKPKLEVGIQDLVRDCDNYFPVVISGESHVTPNSFFMSSRQGDLAVKNYDEQSDTLENLCIYPHIIVDDISIQSEIDKKIILGMPAGLKTDNKNKILFSGGRFFQRTFNRELDYIMILDMIKKPAVYDVFIDRNNAFPLVQSMKMYDKSLDIDMEKYIESVGTFICCEGSVECLLKTSVGEDRFFEIAKDRVDVVPLKLDSPAKLHIKNSTLGSLDIYTVGGEVGLVFDTKVSREGIYSDVKLFNVCVRQFGKSFVKDKE